MLANTTNRKKYLDRKPDQSLVEAIVIDVESNRSHPGKDDSKFKDGNFKVDPGNRAVYQTR